MYAKKFRSVSDQTNATEDLILHEFHGTFSRLSTGCVISPQWGANN